MIKLGNKKAQEANNWFMENISPHMNANSRRRTTQPHVLHLILNGVGSLGELDKALKCDAIGRPVDASRLKKILWALSVGGFITAELDLEYLDEWHNYELSVNKTQLAKYKAFVKKHKCNFIPAKHMHLVAA